MCKKQTAVSHSSTESEIISLDTGLRLDGLPALELWDLFISVLGNVSRVSDRSGKRESDDHKHHKSHNKVDVTKDIDAVPTNVQSARQEALWYVFEDNEAVIKMIVKGRSPTMRHVSRTHRVALDSLFDQIILDTQIQIKYIDTKNQLADILTKGSFTRDGRRTCHSQIATYDESDREDAFGRVFFHLIKPGEDLVWISRSWKICCK